jgi:hypothetical protein
MTPRLRRREVYSTLSESTITGSNNCLRTGYQRPTLVRSGQQIDAEVKLFFLADS